MTVIFSTYQSIDVVANAQKAHGKEFDLVICDEAHRTTGVTLKGNDESSFVRVHDNKFIFARHRIYTRKSIFENLLKIIKKGVCNF